MPFFSSDYPYMIHSNKDRHYYSFYRMGEYKFSAVSDGRGGVGPRKTHFYPQKVYSSTDRHDVFLFISVPSHIIYFDVILEKVLSNDTAEGSSFIISDGNVRGGVGPRTTHLSSVVPPMDSSNRDDGSTCHGTVAPLQTLTEEE